MARSISRRVYDTSGILVTVDSETNYVRVTTGYVAGDHLSIVVLTPEQVVQLVDNLTRARLEIEDRRIDEQVRQDEEGPHGKGWTIRQLREHLRDAHSMPEGNGLLWAKLAPLEGIHAKLHKEKS